MSEQTSVLIVDDEKPICDLLKESLTSQEYRCTTVSNGKDALTAIAEQSFDIALIDIRLPEISGMDILRSLKKEHRNIATIMITAVNDVNTAVEAIQLGAMDYIVKPFSLDRIDTCLHRIIGIKSTALHSEYHGNMTSDNNTNHSRDLTYLGQIDAIARGAEAYINSIDRHSEIVMERTIEVAMNLGIPEKEIKKWVKERVKLISCRDKHFESMLDRLNKSPLLQMIMGQLELYNCETQKGECQN